MKYYQHLLLAYLLTVERISSWSVQESPSMIRRKIVQTGAGVWSLTVSSGGGSWTVAGRPRMAAAAETVGKDPNCDDRSCLGVWDGLLADCPHDAQSRIGAGCTCSQDDTPSIFSEPWDYSEAPNHSSDWEVQVRLLVPTIQLVSARRGDQVQILSKIDRYLKVLFTDGTSGEKSVGEFYFTPNDTTVQFRVGSISGSGSILGSLRNMERCEMIRKELRYLKIPVLRNRKRSLFFVESDLDTFGPGSAALGPPAEMRTGELEGRQDVDPRLKIDLLQQFPFGAK